jgi:hypothetical protein
MGANSTRSRCQKFCRLHIYWRMFAHPGPGSGFSDNPDSYPIFALIQEADERKRGPRKEARVTAASLFGDVV